MSRATILRRIAAALTLGAALAPAARADLTFFTSSSPFITANPGLPTETFETARVSAGAFVQETGPISSATNDTVFHTNDLLPGFTLSSTGAIADPTLIAVGTGTITGATKAVGLGNNNTLSVAFGAGVMAMGANLISSPGAGAPASSSFNVDVYGASGLLGMTTVSVSGASTFFGVDSNGAPITKVTIANASVNGGVFIDNLTFGTPPPQVPVFYSARSDFVATHSGLPTETFESARLNGQAFIAVVGPLNSSTNNGVFNTGDIHPGLSLASIGSTSGNTNLVVTAPNTIPGTSQVVGAQDPGASLEISLGGNATAFGTDLISSLRPGVTSTETYTASIFGASGLIATRTINVTGTDTFFGYDSAGVPITRVTFADTNTTNPINMFVDNITFNGSQAVPEPSALLLTLVALGPLVAYVRHARSPRSGAPDGVPELGRG